MILDEIQHAIILSPELTALLTFLIGLITGHRFALRRDRRTEFNELATPIRTWLIREINKPGMTRERPTDIELDQFSQTLAWWSRKRFLNEYEKQDQERAKAIKQTDDGYLYYEETRHIIKPLKKCLQYTNRK